MPEFFIIYGPPMSGKTINAKAMLERYRCDHVCDFEEFRGGDFKRIIILTNKPGLMGTREEPELFKSAVRLQIKLVKQDLGDRWVEPIPGYRAEEKAEPGKLCEDDLAEDNELWCINEQIKGLLLGFGASEDHESVLSFLRSTGLPEGTVRRVHKAIVCAEKK